MILLHECVKDERSFFAHFFFGTDLHRRSICHSSGYHTARHAFAEGWFCGIIRFMMLKGEDVMSVENGQWIMYGIDADDPRCIHTPEELAAYVRERYPEADEKAISALMK